MQSAPALRVIGSPKLAAVSCRIDGQRVAPTVRSIVSGMAVMLRIHTWGDPECSIRQVAQLKLGNSIRSISSQ